MTTKAKRKYFDFKFNQNDTILFDRESAGVPQLVHKSVDYKLIIPIQKKEDTKKIQISIMEKIR